MASSRGASLRAPRVIPGVIMSRILVLLLTPVFFLSGSRTSTSGENKPVRVLMVLGAGSAHDIRKFAPIMENVLDKAGGFKVTRLEPPKDKKPDDPEHMTKLADLKRA